MLGGHNQCLGWRQPVLSFFFFFSPKRTFLLNLTFRFVTLPVSHRRTAGWLPWVGGAGLCSGGLGGVEPWTSQMKVSQSSDWKLKKKKSDLFHPDALNK